MTAGTGSPGIRSFGLPAGTASSGKAVGTESPGTTAGSESTGTTAGTGSGTVPDRLDQQRASSQLA
ncbi:unnamed protein product [Staurois parvus]|uniref:Uncharacterized protein n=1 Tax=Staurois parvus TaxID=386267 RepID=A0ABN9F8Y3_9NEOB|nr:unnamed protein product [Staurois parvus]